MISSIIQALAKFRVVRIGRHEPSLEDIYRRAVSAKSKEPSPEVAA
jgi:hypothetical protein